MKKVILGIVLGILLQKAAVSIQWYSWDYYNEQCVKDGIAVGTESFKCAEERQGIFHYIGFAAGTITPNYGGTHTWRY